MRRSNFIAASILCAAIALPATVSAQPTVTGELAFRSKYLFAGIPFAADQVQQAKLTLGTGALTLNAFSVYDFDASDVTEADIYGDYYVQASPLVGLFVGAALYNFRFSTGWDGTPELYAGAVISVLFSPTLYVAHDFDLGDGTHALLTISHSVPLGTSGATLDLTGDVDYNAEYYTPESGLSYADVIIAVSLPIGPLTVSPMFLVQRRLDDAFAGWVLDDELFGITASMVF